jgi:hypothetical protein
MPRPLDSLGITAEPAFPMRALNGQRMQQRESRLYLSNWDKGMRKEDDTVTIYTPVFIGYNMPAELDVCRIKRQSELPNIGKFASAMMTKVGSASREAVGRGGKMIYVVTKRTLKPIR